MIFTIHKNCRRAWPPIIGFLFGKKMERIIYFDISAKYDHAGTADDEDVNKLFGFFYLSWKAVWLWMTRKIDKIHHWNSVRYGWNYNNQTQKVNLYSYCYTNGKRSYRKIGEIPTYQKIKAPIDIIGAVYSFTVTDALNSWFVYGGHDAPASNAKGIRLKLGCYFGGNNPAPHKIKIKISKK